MTFNNFFHKHNLKSIATSIIKIQQVFSSIGVNNVDIFLQDGPFTRDIGTFTLRSSKGAHWVVYTNENNFDRYGCSPSQKLSKIDIKNEMDIVYIQNTEYKEWQVK